MSDSDEKIVYVRLPEETLMRLDIACARRRIKRPAGIALSVETWLEGQEQKSSSGNPLSRDNVPDTEADKWSGLLQVLERIDGRLRKLEEDDERGSGNPATAPGVKDKVSSAIARGKGLVAATEAAKAEFEGNRSHAARGKKRAG